MRNSLSQSIIALCLGAFIFQGACAPVAPPRYPTSYPVWDNKGEVREGLKRPAKKKVKRDPSARMIAPVPPESYAAQIPTYGAPPPTATNLVQIQIVNDFIFAIKISGDPIPELSLAPGETSVLQELSQGIHHFHIEWEDRGLIRRHNITRTITPDIRIITIGTSGGKGL